MMNYSEFKQGLMNAMQERYGFDYQIEEQKVKKANIGEVDAISISRYDVGMLIYPDQMYKEYTTRHISIDDMITALDNQIPFIQVVAEDAPKIDLSREGIQEGKAESRVYFKMIGIPGNEEFLKEIPYAKAEGFDDIALIPVVGVDVAGKYGTVIIKKDHIAAAGITAEELHAAAFRNTDRLIMFHSLSDEIKGMIGEDVPFEFDSPLLIARANSLFSSTSAAPIGAPSLLKQIYEQVGDHYVIPSSVNEILILPKTSEIDVSYLQSMIRDVNLTLRLEDRLSDSVFECKDGKYTTHSFSAAGAGAGDRIGSAMHDDPGLVNYGPTL